jgi:glycosyltransferase involved in cell wall biosynthesis
MNIFCSTIIPTVGRPSLGRSVASVLQQQLDGEEFEIIVVNDSGVPLPPADWQRASRVRVIHTNRRERSVARNAGAAIARGRYLHFLDDDDWLEPGALHHLWRLANQSGAAWLYGSTQALDRQGVPLIQLYHQFQGNCFLPTMAGEWIPLQASLIDAQVFCSLGGFNPLLCGPEDIDLLRRVALHYQLAGVEAIVANMLFGEAGSTTNLERHPLQSRWAREYILDEPGAFARMRNSLNQQPDRDLSEWKGRIVRIYLTSMMWNLQRRNFWSALCRAAHALVSIAAAGPSLFANPFWRAIGRPYASHTFARGMAAVSKGNG